MNLNIADLLGAHHKLIMDPVHGGIPLLKHEVDIVDHSLFQRLRFICQNDILSLVFPGATHSRFLHSIGAMHVGGRMFMAMVENSLKYRKRNNISGIDSQTLESISFFNRLVRVACLLHDSGHCSFSHQFNRTSTIQNLLSEPHRFDALWNEIDTRFMYPTSPSVLEHEHYSIRVAYQILSEVISKHSELQCHDILALMDTANITPSEQFSKHADALWPLIKADDDVSAPPKGLAIKLRTLLSHIVSGELDADRADYMLRDGFHSSVTIGGFNLDHLLSNLHFGWCSQTGWFGIAISEKGLGSLEDFVYSRYQMYRQVYAHKTAQGFDWLLRSAMEEVLQKPETLKHVDHSLQDINLFKHITDNYFWEAFRLHAEQSPNSYSRCILERIKMPHLATRVNLTQEEQDHYIEFLAQEHQQHKENIVASSITARFTKIRDNFDELKILVNDHQTRTSTLRLISKTSHFFGKFTDDRITHFYINPLSI